MRALAAASDGSAERTPNSLRPSVSSSSRNERLGILEMELDPAVRTRRIHKPDVYSAAADRNPADVRQRHFVREAGLRPDVCEYRPNSLDPELAIGHRDVEHAAGAAEPERPLAAPRGAALVK